MSERQAAILLRDGSSTRAAHGDQGLVVPLRIALAYNMRHLDVPAEANFAAPETIEWLVEAMAALGHEVELVEVSRSMLAVATHLETCRPELVFNIAEGA